MFTVAVRTADSGEAGARVAAVEIALDDLLDDRPEGRYLNRPVSLSTNDDNDESDQPKAKSTAAAA